jgi:hypothetical protein
MVPDMEIDFTTVTLAQLNRAIQLKERIEGLQKKLEQVLGVTGVVPSAPAKAAVSAPKRKKRRFSPEGKARLLAGIQARWAKYRAGKGIAPAPKTAKAMKPAGLAKARKPAHKKPFFSAAARAAISAAQKARWAKKRAKAAATKPA